jgi:Ca-activated chloride channel homolog
VTFATPLGLLALLAIPAIVAIHLFRRRFPVRLVAGLFLWQTPDATPVAGRRFDRLPITASLILECLAALALALILAGARLSSAGGERHLVVLLDDSASMAAANDAGESARDRAARRVATEIERLGSGARVTLVLSGERPAVIAGPAAFAVEARSALDAWAPQARDHALTLSLRLARELAGRDGDLLVVSDLAPEARGEAPLARGLWVAVGEPLANVGILAAERSLHPADGRGTVTLTLGNHAGATIRRQVTVAVAGKSIVARSVDVPSGVSSLTLDLPPGLPPVDVALSDDALARDNAVVLVEPRPRVVAVDNRLPAGRGHDALVRAIDAVSGVTRAEPGHLAFVDADRLDEPGPAGTWLVGFGLPPAAWLSPGDAEDFGGPFVLEKRHPMLDGVTLGGIAWTGARPLAQGAVHPLVSAGNRPLAGARQPTADDLGVLFNLDLDRTNLIRSPDWPILISNLVEMRRAALPGPQRWNYRVGEWVRVGLGRDPAGPLKYTAGGVERTLPAARQLEFLAPSPGGLLQIMEGDDVLYELGVNFLDEAETDLRGQTTADSGELSEASGPRTGGGPASDPLFWLLLAIGGTAIVVNWCLLPRGHVRA